jgi:hypothetical protein
VKPKSNPRTDFGCLQIDGTEVNFSIGADYMSLGS